MRFPRASFVVRFLTLLNRFIPNREGQDLQATYSLLGEEGCPSTPSRTKKRAPHGELHFQRSMYRMSQYKPS